MKKFNYFRLSFQCLLSLLLLLESPIANATETSKDLNSSANAEVIFLSRQLQETMASMPHERANPEMDRMRMDMMQTIYIQSQEGRYNSASEFKDLFLQKGTQRAIGVAGNVSRPAAKLLWMVLTGQAKDEDFQKVAEALTQDPSRGGDFSVELLSRIRKNLSGAQRAGRYGLSPAMNNWIENSKIDYKIAATPTGSGFQISPQHSIVLNFEADQAGERGAKTRFGIQQDICREKLGAAVGGIPKPTCHNSAQTGLNIGGDIAGTRNQFGQYWSWKASVQHNHGGRYNTRDSQEGRIGLTIPLY